ncbi:molybdenum ABC transporter ATP-binding protein [Aestuariicoccus sp. MJ-SS9]|uniref:molybdenum ABC transporter ATP-binding protein n=1 Tax=Aestuariicoccus sp. MJ-SS9 TaxID=3079855 RepID=UPI002910C6B3|nr:molybdenum ABC transporter ATP-binding protein [Aestuariicoccus sp. MJ-SS9]MDU8911232.1 molybdenum ABC transporter ATP-binding protein [Aestuariicoccus sp. MJ-SS9]
MTLSVQIRARLGAFDLDVGFDAPAGVTVLFGRSGSGKTSLVKAVAGLVRPDAGRIAVGGRVLFDAGAGIDVPVPQRRLGYVFQEGRLFPHLSVRDNLLYARRVTGRRGGDLDRVVDLLGIAPLLARRPGALSGGEAQRVAIGRALLSDPDMLLMDEPLAALDAARKAEILPYLERLRSETGLPILYVSHNMAEVARLATHVVVLEDGRVFRAGAAEDLLSDPSMVRVLGVRDAGAVLPARVAAQAGDGVTELAVSGGRLCLPEIEAAVGTALRVRILAQDVILATERPRAISALNILPVTVLALRRGHGPGVIVQLQAGGDRLLARVTRRSADALGLAPGKPCFAVLKSVAVAQSDIGQRLAPEG